MLKKLRKTIKKYNIFQKGEKILVAVSGGQDSVALLDAFVRLDIYELAVGHFNHLTRGAESDGDEVFVKELCQRYGIPFYSDKADVKKIAKQKGMSFQNAAREVRYGFLRKTAKMIGASKIAFAHHADDQVETVFMNILRGSGLKGISGMVPLEGDIARPLLEITRSEIQQYILEEKLYYRLDASNLETYYSRNRLRHEVLPLLVKFNPSLSYSICKMSEIIRGEEEYLSMHVNKYFNTIAQYEREEIIIDIEAFSKLDIAVKRRLILMALAKVANTEKDFSFRHVEDILKLSVSGSGLSIHLPHNIRVKTTYGKLHFSKVEVARESLKLLNIELFIPGKTIAEGIGEFSAEYINADMCRSDAYTVYLQEENIILPLSVRSRKPGDIVRLLGGTGKIKIKEFFIDMHIARQVRDAVPLVVDASGEIVWVAGVRPGEKCRISHPGQILKLTFTPFEGITE